MSTNLSVPQHMLPELNSRSSSESSLHRVKNLPGYTTPVFKGKKEQRALVENDVASKGFIPRELVAGEVDWFYSNLGIDDTYFQNESREVISDHIIALFGAKIMAYTKHDPSTLVIDLEKINEKGNGGTFIHTSAPGLTSTEGPGATCEARIDELFLDNSSPENAYRLETFRSGGSISATASQQLRCYFVTKCNFPKNSAKLTADGRTDIHSVSDSAFLEKATKNTLDIYQQVMWNVESRYGPVIEVFEVEGSRERRLVIGYKMGGTSKFFSALSNLYHFYSLYSARKYVEQFSNGITIISMYLNPLPNVNAPPIEHSIFQVMKEASLLFCLPDNPYFLPKALGSHAVQEATYAYCGWIFAQHFCNRLGPAYLQLKNVLNENDATHAEVLNDIKRRFREETFTRESIAQVIHAYPELIRLLYVNFAMTHYPTSDEASQIMPTLSYQRLQTVQPLTDNELYDRIRRTVPNKHELQVLESFLIFNKHVLKTNFYQPTKVALSFRLAPDFLPEVEYPKKPFGMFLVIGNEFRGFHIRFRDVARGGIRIVMSRNRETYSINQRQLFDENYALASTQSLKNKDIPEGGAKGTILPSIGASPRRCFEKYVDAVLDLLIPGKTPGIKERLVDLYGKPELLFFGPDEGTADMMDWAATHARDRGADTWKSFTTGKSAENLGGVPHDTYGMTSLSIRQYVLGLYKQLGLREKDITKVQTGGPDGDLGSNEILLSSDKTVAIIDGSGVLADPAGIDRTELIRLAKLRVPVSNFNTSKLSKDGYLVKVEDQDTKLPSGEVVLDGTDFRNGAHLRFKADLFVPCGGRPEAVNISNMAALVDAEGKPHFKYIVEGANLFLTQQARLHLEKRKVILFKDSSTNKGGVTSSSLEVLAGLALSTQEYLDLMIFKEGKPSQFYQSYVKDVQGKIIQNAAAEFQCIWREHARLQGTKTRTAISDELSSTLNNLQTELEASDLFNDVPSRKGVMSRAIPKTLVDKVGLETLLERLPEPYQRALFSSWVASNFVYKYGVNASSVDFFHFARDLANSKVEMGHHHHLETPALKFAMERADSSFEEIPIIDLRDATSQDPAVRRALADLIRDACINVGFFYLKNHGISDDKIDKTVDAAIQFFSLPESTKMELDIHKSSNYKGYTALLGENVNSEGRGDLHEGFDLGWEPETPSDLSQQLKPDSAMAGKNIWPDGLPGFKDTMMTYYGAAVDLGKLLFSLFALALDLPENYFEDKTTRPAAIMRILHYPPQHPTTIDANDKQIGIGAHTDYECFTILWQDACGGLQVQNAEGKWIAAVPIPGTLVVNLGDQFARWTNDVFKSTMHRVINLSGRERFSIPLFFGTDYHVLLEPISTCVSPGTPAKYPVMTAGDYVKSRLEATYDHSATTN